jgi:metal-dependent amidase/aminoacylase/carboxypeptidase family protein
MRRHLIIALFLLAAADRSAAQTPSISPAQRAEVDRLAADLHSKVVETRRDIHMHPELGYRETRTAALIAERLRALGFDQVRTGITGTVRTLSKDGPATVRAKMEAIAKG